MLAQEGEQVLLKVFEGHVRKRIRTLGLRRCGVQMNAGQQLFPRGHERGVPEIHAVACAVVRFGAGAQKSFGNIAQKDALVEPVKDVVQEQIVIEIVGRDRFLYGGAKGIGEQIEPVDHAPDIPLRKGERASWRDRGPDRHSCKA